MDTTGGITDEAAIETHDLIHDAELEEQRVCILRIIVSLLTEMSLIMLLLYSPMATMH